MDSASPLWPNPAPTGPITLTNRIPGDSSGRAGSSVYRLGDSDITITVIDGEPLTDILNRVYALGRLMGEHDAISEAIDPTGLVLTNVFAANMLEALREDIAANPQKYPHLQCHCFMSAGPPWYAAGCKLPNGHEGEHDFGTQEEAHQAFYSSINKMQAMSERTLLPGSHVHECPACYPNPRLHTEAELKEHNRLEK